MFSFFSMMDNYEARKVDRYEDEATGLTVSTAMVTDSAYPYETAIQHPEYNQGKWIIVANYTSEERAKEGHAEWVKKMTAQELPEVLIDVSESGVASILDAFPSEEMDWRVFSRKPK